ncbi:MAG: hypothetical protein ABR582_08320 [Gemmatimonadaceae bacterium]
MTRRSITLAIIGFWLSGLALLYKRSTAQSPEQTLVAAGMRVSPQTYYYRVEMAGKQIGAASSAIDTTTTQLTATDFIRAAVPSRRGTSRMQARSEAHFSRALHLRDLIVKVQGQVPQFLLRGVLQGEGSARTFQVTTETPRRHATTNEYDVAGMMFVPSVAPLPVMLAKTRKPGVAFSTSIFDPMSRTIRSVNLKVERDSLFTVTDSAALDSSTARWVKAHSDTVRGWLISGDVPLTTLWVDESGRMIEASEPGGISFSRSAFEIAFENWRLETMAQDSSRRRHRNRETQSKVQLSLRTADLR